MASAWSPVLARPVLADLLPRSLVRDVGLVVGGTLLTAVFAQVVVPLPFSPVPLSASTFAVLLTAAALGPLRGVLSQGLYLLGGLVGLPFFAGAESGWTYVSGATGGYIVGYVVAAAVVGACARRGMDRRAGSTALAFAAGSLAIYACGVPWLAVAADLSPGAALAAGLWPFLIGDAIKAALAAAVLPGAWRLVNR